MSDHDPQVQVSVSAIVRDLLHALPEGEAPTPERVLALFWPYVRTAVAEIPGAAPPPKTDKRTKPWQYTVRFWLQTEAGPDLQAETDPAVMPSTGEIPSILSDLGIQMHGEETPIDLSPQALKGRLQQLRNNLGRYGTAALRIEYDIGDESYLAQMDVVRLESSV